MVGSTIKKQFEFNLTFNSLIGKTMKIVSSTNKNQIGMKGVLVKETSKFIYLRLKNGSIKQLSKLSLVIEFKYENKIVSMNCNAIKGTIQQRLKKLK